FLSHTPLTTAIYTLSLHDALPICDVGAGHERAGKTSTYNALMLKKISREVFVRTHRFWGFLESDAVAINKARMTHLASLDLRIRSEEHTSELQSRGHLVCRLLLEK